MELCLTFCEIAWVGGLFEEEWIHAYIWLSSFVFTRNYHNIVNQLYLNTHTHTQDFFKMNEIQSLVVMWMDLKSVIQSEVSQKERNKHGY